LSEELKNTVSFEDKEYDVAELPERGQLIVGFVREIREEGAVLKKRLSILQAAEITFSKELEEILTAPEQENLEGMD